MNNQNNDRGAALLIVLSTLALLFTVTAHLSLNSRLQYELAAQSLNSLQALEAAQSRAKIALLELKIADDFRKSPFAKQISGFHAGLLRFMWQTPFIYKPSAQEQNKSLFHGTVQSEVEDETAKINLNLLGTAQYRDGVAQLFQMAASSLISKDDNTYQKFRDIPLTILASNVADWVDPDGERLEGGVEDTLYQRYTPPYRSKSAPLKTLNEVLLVDNWTPDFFQLIRPYLTVFGQQGLNLNTADPLILKGISPLLSDDDIKVIVETRNNKAFEAPADFIKWAQETLGKGENFNKNPSVLLTTESTLFQIRAQATVGRTTKRVIQVCDLKQKLESGEPATLYWNYD